MEWDGDDGRRQSRLLSRRRLLRGAAATGIGASTLAMLAGCSSRSRPASRGAGVSGAFSSGNPLPGGILKAFLGSNVVSFDPHLVSASASICSGALSRPFRYKTSPDPKTASDHDVESDAALSAESPDAITWTVKLRPNVTFQNIAPVNGHALEAEDVRSTFIRALGQPRNPNRGALGMIDPNQIEAIAPDTVVFKLRYPYAPFPKILTSPNYAWILPREALAGAYDPAKQMIGSGPFILDHYTPDVGAVFNKNPSWFESASGRPYVDGVQIAIIPSAAQQLAQLLSGNLDEGRPTINDLPTVQRSSPKVTNIPIPALTTQPVFFQLGDPDSVFQDIRIRQAISMAVDRPAYAKAFTGGAYDQTIFVCAFLGKWALKANELSPDVRHYYEYHPDEAKKLVDQTGVSRLQFQYPIVVNTPYASQSASAEMVNNMINAIGIKTTIVEKDFQKDYIDSGKGIRQGYFDKDMIVYSGQAPYDDVDEVVFNYFHSKATSNQEHLKDPTVDSMIDKARTIINEDERLKAYLDIQRYLAAKVYVVSTASRPTPYSFQPWVKNYCPGTLNGIITETYSKLWLQK